MSLSVIIPGCHVKVPLKNHQLRYHYVGISAVNWKMISCLHFKREARESRKKAQTTSEPRTICCTARTTAVLPSNSNTAFGKQLYEQVRSKTFNGKHRWCQTNRVATCDWLERWQDRVQFLVVWAHCHRLCVHYMKAAHKLSSSRKSSRPNDYHILSHVPTRHTTLDIKTQESLCFLSPRFCPPL